MRETKIVLTPGGERVVGTPLGFVRIVRGEPANVRHPRREADCGQQVSSRPGLREQRGLAYSVYSFRAALQETGILAVSAGTAPDRFDELLDVLEDQLDRVVADGGISDRERRSAQGHLRGSLALSLESSGSRMHRLGRSELTLGEIPSLDDPVARIDEVTADDIARVVGRVLRPGLRTLAVVGPVTSERVAERVA